MEDKTGEKRGIFIVRLNFVDFLTLSGVFFVGTAISFLINKNYEYALSVLYLAIIADAFDGILARKYGLTRDFGRYLDGFVDTIDYLIAPALFLFLWGFNSLIHGIILCLFVCCGFVRLSVFNEIGNLKDEDNGLSYLGAPVFWSTLLLGPIYLASTLIGKEFVFLVLSVVIPAFSLLMIHNGRYHKFKNPKRILIFLVAMSLLFLFVGELRVQPETSTTLTNHFITGLVASIPVIVGGIIHMMVVSFDWFSFLKIPINEKLLGANKTYRGLIVMPLGSMLGFLAVISISGLSTNYFTVDFEKFSWVTSGFIIGTCYVLAELPNSFFKRRMGVPPGGTPTKNARLFILLDQLDSGLLCLLAYFLLWRMPWQTCIATLIMMPLIALGIKRILFGLGLKKTAT